MPEPEEPTPEEEPADEQDVLQPTPNPRPLGVRRGSVGLKIPGYQIERVIGRGSTGTVYRARQENVDREVALKVLHKELTGRPRMVRRLQREARTTARLAHPHIVSAIDMGRTGDRWWFAMELVDGPSLALKLRQEGRLSEREALRLFIPLCEALVHIWENGVVHRDIKPANILIDKVSGARLADLGLAFADDDPHLTGSEGTLGTPHYISPEQARDPSSVDIRTDIWSFGATLFHAVCGEPPMSGANVAEVLSGVLYGRIPDPIDLEPDLSRGLSLVLRKCMSRDFERRYQTPRELLRDLERVRERRRPKVRAASLEPTSGSGSHVPRLVFVMGVLGVVLLGAFLLWKRPWDASDRRQVYAPLAALGSDLDRRAEAPGPILAKLEGLRAELPAADLAVWRELLSEARAQLGAALFEIEKETGDRFERDLLAGDFGRAGIVISAELQAQLVDRAGVSLDKTPPEFRLRISGMENRLERSVSNATVRLRTELLAAFSGPFLAEIDALIEAGRWRAAAERLSITPDDLPLELGVVLDALPTERAASLVDLLRGRLSDARVDLDRRWGLFDDELVRWIDLAARDLSDDLSTNLEPVNAGALLRDAFAQELSRRGVSVEELLVEPAGLARQKLAEAAADLEEYERRLAGGRESGDRGALDSLAAWLDESAGGQAYAARRYEDVEAYWVGRQEWLAKNSSSAAPWWSELERRVQTRLAELQLLTELRSRALDGLTARDGKVVELHMSADVRAQGTLSIESPGPAGGIRFTVAKDREYELFLSAPRGGLPRGARLLEAADIEVFGTAELEPARANLARGIFRFREGDLEGAFALLRRPEIDPDWADLCAEYVRSIERGRSVRAELESRRLDQVRSLLATLYFDEPDRLQRLERDPERALLAIDRLLGEFRDLTLVTVKSAELEAMAQQLRGKGVEPDLAAFEKAFGVGIVRFPGPNSVELYYDFAAVEVPGLTAGSWSPDGAGWLSPGDIASDADLLGRVAPRLVLRRPIDVDSGAVVCEFEFTEPVSTGDERLVLVSVAGFEFVVRTPARATSSTVLSGTRGAEKLLEDLRAGAGDIVPRALLIGGNTHLLRLELDKRRGRLLVLLDGEEVLHKDLTKPLHKPGSYGLLLRSREQVRLLTIRVVAAR